MPALRKQHGASHEFSRPIAGIFAQHVFLWRSRAVDCVAPAQEWRPSFLRKGPPHQSPDVTALQDAPLVFRDER